MTTITQNSSHVRAARRSSRRRDGLTFIELVVSAMLLITIMSFITSICLQTSLIWKDIGHHRAAVNELSNQLERLTRLTPDEARQALGSLQPSAVCSRTLNKPQLSAELIDDNLGLRVVMQIDWKRRNPGKPVELVGWMLTADKARQEADQ